MSEERTVEQLWQALDGATGRDRLEVLNALAQGLGLRGDFSQALSLADVACVEADQLEAYPEMVEARLSRGQALYGLDEYERSSASHEEAAAIAEQHLDNALRARALTFAGDSLAPTDQLGRAADLFARAEAVARDGDLTFEAAQAAQFLGRVLWRADDNAEALEALDRARVGYREVGATSDVLDTDDLRASALLDLGRSGDAVEVLRGILHVVESVPVGDVPYARRRLGFALRLAGEPAAALPLLEAAAAGYAERKVVASTGDCLREQAACHWGLDDVGAAFAALARARAHLDAAGHDEAVVRCDILKAAWLHGTGEFEAAAAVNQRLLDHPDGHTAAWARWRLVDNHFAGGSTQKAAEILDGWPSDVELPDDLAFARVALAARVLLASGRREEAWVAAMHGLEQADDDSAPLQRAWLYDIRAQLGRNDVSTDRAHAIALYLAAGRMERARELSRSFLPAAPASTSETAHHGAQAAEADHDQRGALGH